MDGIIDLNQIVSSNKDEYERLCYGCALNDDCPEAAGALDDVLTALSLIDEAFEKIISITKVLSEIIACERVNSIYVDLIYEATCTDMPYALTWMFAMLLIFSSLGLTIITFRAAILPPKKALDYHDRIIDNVDETSHQTSKPGVEVDIVTALTVQKVESDTR